jgi:UrcA family protein
MKNPIALLAAACLATSAFTAVHADTFDPPRAERVQFADLDVSNTQGVAILYSRLRQAARDVCRDLDPSRSMSLYQRHAECMQAALSRAVAEVGITSVNRYAAAHGIVVGGVAIRIANGR